MVNANADQDSEDALAINAKPTSGAIQTLNANVSSRFIINAIFD